MSVATGPASAASDALESRYKDAYDDLAAYGAITMVMDGLKRAAANRIGTTLESLRVLERR